MFLNSYKILIQHFVILYLNIPISVKLIFLKDFSFLQVYYGRQLQYLSIFRVVQNQGQALGAKLFLTQAENITDTSQT